MNTSEIEAKLSTLELSSFPRLGYPSCKKAEIMNGKRVEVKSCWNRGHSGKGFTSLFYVDGKRVAKAKLAEVIAA